MALVVESGSGSATAESYVSVADANTYFTSSRGDSADYSTSGEWLHADTSTAMKEACLRWATRTLDLYVLWPGEKSSTTQALRWPRRYVIDVDDDEILATTIPTWLKNANCELARGFLLEDRTEDPEIGLSSVGQLVFNPFDRAGVLSRAAKDIILGSIQDVSFRGSRSREAVRS